MIAGIDGCPGAWIAVSRTDEGEIDSHHVIDLESFLESQDWTVVAIDIPIGLVETGARLCDVQARQMLGARKSSVFPAPIRPALLARDRASADEISRSIQGKGVGSQSFGIYSKVKEVDEVLQSRPDLRNKLFEIHPELCFYAWNGAQPMRNPKRTGQGFMERLALVESEFGSDAFANVRDGYGRSKVHDDDILDAFAALWTAERIAKGVAESCPNPPETDSTGIVMAMWY